ncbi:Nuclear mitotic apparatus 1 [Quillaja saponaria]|uniref:Nuclear mitotic apparatus 1 n=1 Tax=Quillaja saponaria TaxID=32244 RepID=A0AAD7Q465_QUISA|nr:Nuclear mitotic apparatus 1 [Quillaja saponaria]
MEDESQKLMALKKAYAEIILNTAKEAAARIMVSERRALGFQQDLCSTKEEALRMLVRLKKMIEAKTTEAEMTSLRQQRKIDELEAQLHEAEDVVTDLRMELKQVWHKLEMVKNSQVQPFNAPTAIQVASSQNNAVLVPIISSPNRNLEALATFDVNNSALNGRGSDGECCNATKQTKKSCVSQLENYYVHDSDFPSIIMRRKEPELCRNGCTQRILAFERNLSEEKFPTGNADNQHVAIKNKLIVKASDKEDGKCDLQYSVTKNREIIENSSTEVRKPVKICRKRKRKTVANRWSSFLSCCDTYAVNGNIKLSKSAHTRNSVSSYFINKVKRRKRRYRAATGKLSPVVNHCLSILHNVKSGKNLLKINDSDAKIAPLPHLDILESDDNSKPLHHLDLGLLLVKGDTAPICGHASVGLVQRAEEEDRLLFDESVLRNLEGTSAENLTVSDCRMELEVVDVPLNTEMEDVETFEENNKSPSLAEDSRLLKYTFRRKRRKETLSYPDQITSSEMNTVEGRVEKKQNGSPETQKSSLINES